MLVVQKSPTAGHFWTKPYFNRGTSGRIELLSNNWIFDIYRPLNSTKI